MHPDAHIPNDEQRPSSVLSQSELITPTKSKARSLLADYAERSDMHAQTPGSVDNTSLRQPGNLTNETSSGKSHALGAFKRSTHLPTPQSPGNVASYLLTRTPMPTHNLQPDPDSTALPTAFRSHASSSPPPFRPHSIPTPESSPLVARSRNNRQHLSQSARISTHDNNDFANPNERNAPRSRVSTPPRASSRQTSTRPVSPVSQSRPTTPFPQGPSARFSPTSSGLDNLRLDDSTTTLLQGTTEGFRGETAHIRTQQYENHLVSTQATESRRPDYLKRMRRLAPSSSAGGTSLISDVGGQDGSLLWSSANVGVIESPAKGKRIALFQETSEESFEESLMAGGYGRYRSDGPWKFDEDAEASNHPGDAVGEEPGSRLALTEKEKRKKTRLAAFFDPPRVTSSTTHLFPVKMEGCGRVLMKAEPSEPQTSPKPTPKAKRSRKRKKTSVDVKQDVDKDNTAAPEDGTVDGPNWPDTEFPWSRLGQDSLPSVEREERLRYIEGFFDRDSDEDDVEDGCSSSSRRGLDEVPSRSLRPGRGKTYPLLSHSKGRLRGTTTDSIIPSDPADARTALLSKKSIRAVQLRLLRRRGTDRAADGDDSEVLCICRGRDDGRQLVQCDACRTWYHLECIGIRSTSELGREEDPWFCANCAEVKTPPPVTVPLPEPTFAPTDDELHGDSADVEGYDPPFLNARLNPSPAAWTRSVKPPTTPPRTRYAPHNSSGSSWDEPPSSSSRGDPHTPQINTASAFGDIVQVYGTTPGRSLEAPSTTTVDESPFDPTSTPSRGINFGLPFTTPKDGRWGPSLWQGARGSGHELFHTPKHLGEDGGAASLRYGEPLLYHGRVGEDSEEGPSGVQGLHRTTGPNNVTPVERDALGGLKRIQALESPLGAKRSRRTVDS